MTTIRQNNVNLSFPDSVEEQFGKELALFNPVRIEKLYALIDEHTPNKIENLPKIPLYESALYNSEIEYAITSMKYFKEFIQSLKDFVDLITLNDIIKRNPIFCCPIQL